MRRGRWEPAGGKQKRELLGKKGRGRERRKEARRRTARVGGQGGAGQGGGDGKCFFGPGQDSLVLEPGGAPRPLSPPALSDWLSALPEASANQEERWRAGRGRWERANGKRKRAGKGGSRRRGAQRGPAGRARRVGVAWLRPRARSALLRERLSGLGKRRLPGFSL